MASSNTPEIVVLHRLIHRADPEDLADEIEKRLPNATIHTATSAAESAEYIQTADIAVGAFLTEQLLSNAEQLSWFQTVSAGVDHLPYEEIDERSIHLTSASGVHAEPVAEQAIAYMLAFERDLPRALEQKNRREFRPWVGGELHGKTLGVVGLGSIGTRVAELGDAFGMEILGTKRDPSTAPSVVETVYGPSSTEQLCAQSDYVVLTCPLTERTRGLIDERKFGSMASDSVLINLARGGVVDEEALITALQRGEIAGAALDVFTTEPLPENSPLWNLSNVLLTPHIGGSTPKYWERCADIFVENYEHYVNEDYGSMTNRMSTVADDGGDSA
ncbi:D-2-hydroxyacid dehydrogenase [Natrialba swarupiae]|uniref:D-2-hydroxyacid dehydrogenase n=1 Tax=Natrialba swarupiae TaxID=2448032 RepID=A0A5D5AF52_9EURY|nr:D-2-hydroxyacid dehydrogenase [Natrialba swarupiae]TYT60419.1 D-2-hydroxyacid dehydrogenase [Natrialba swarupiae]